MRRRWWPLVVSLATFCAGLACATVTTFNPLDGAAPASGPTSEAAARQLEVLAALDLAVRERYIRADLDGVDWTPAVLEAQTRLAAGLSEADFAEAMRALVGVLPDGNAAFQTRAERIAAETADTSTYQGIGVFYGFRETPEPRVVVLEVVDGSPAETAGLQAHDAIYAIDGEPVRAEERATISSRIRGEAGTTVTVSVQTPGEARRDVTIQRGTIAATDRPRGGPLGDTGLVYYRVPVVASADLAQVIAQDLDTQSQAQPLTGLILDLRTAGSSAGWPLLEMLTLFADGAMGEFYTRATVEPLSVEGVDVGGSQTLPLIILIGPDTRGTAEVFAGSLQSAGRATLIGLPTPGETEGFDEVALPDGSQLTLATASFRLPDGVDFSVTGLRPDVDVDRDWDTYAPGADDPVLEAALTQLSK